MANALKIDLTDKVVILSGECYGYKGNEENRKFKCESGFGCKPFTRGSAIFGYFIRNNEKSKISGYDIEKLA